MKHLVRSRAILLVVLSTSALHAQQKSGEPVVLQTFVSEEVTSLHYPDKDLHQRYWAFYYNDVGILDSIYYRGEFDRRELGGLSKLKPFVTEMYDWQTLPPNRGPFPYNIFASLRLVLTEPEPGSIRIIETSLRKEDSNKAPKVIEYEYDTATNRVHRFGGYSYTYEDSAGYLVRISQRSLSRLYGVWQLHRDESGVIKHIEYFRPMMARKDSLRRIASYRILRWQPHQQARSARMGPRLGEAFERFPWLKEGKATAWIKERLVPDSRLDTSRIYYDFDSEGRLIRAENEESRTISYHKTGPIEHEVILYEGDTDINWSLQERVIVSGKSWRDVVVSLGGKYKSNDQTHIYQYENSYRYEDGLWGDRFSPDLVYQVDDDTIKLRIEEPRSLKGLTVCVIDTSEKEVAQIPITGRKTTFIFHRRPRTSYAIRWKYDGRKIVDQAF
jgi:hypothetical protein